MIDSPMPKRTTQAKKTDKRWYRTGEVALELGVSRRTIASRCTAGHIRAAWDPISRQWRIPADEFARLAMEMDTGEHNDIQA